MITIQLNGAPRELPNNTTVRDLLEQLGVMAGPVAVELNREIVPKTRFAETTLAGSDEVEIVTAVGGG